MTGSTPWWGTLLVAFLALAGIFWTQFRADRREELTRRDATNKENAALLRTAYQDLFELMGKISNTGGYKVELNRVASTIRLFAANNISLTVQSILDAAVNLSDINGKYGGNTEEYRTAHKQMERSIDSAVRAIRKSLELDRD